MELLALVERLGGGKEEKPGVWVVSCPAHDDHKPSLKVSAEGNRLLIACRAGCPNERIVAAAGLEWKDLFVEDAKKKKKAATYSYQDADGNELYQVIRFDPKGFTQCRKAKPGEQGAKYGFIYSLEGVTRVPYRLPEIVHGDQRRRVFIVEGEKDVHSLEALGFLATTNSGGAGKWRDEYSEYFSGRTVTILPDNDEPGREHAQQVKAALESVAKKVEIFELPGLPEKGDVTDWIEAGGTAQQLKDLLSGKVSTEHESESIAAKPEELALLLTLKLLNGKFSAVAAEMLDREVRGC